MASRSAASITLRRPNVLGGIASLHSQQHYTPPSPHAVTAPMSSSLLSNGTRETTEHGSAEDDAVFSSLNGEGSDTLQLPKSEIHSAKSGLLSAKSACERITAEPTALKLSNGVGEVFCFRPAPVDTTCVCVPVNVVQVVELIARCIHELWSKNKIDAGWSFGPERDDERKLHPSLKPYDELSESEKSYDIDLVEETIKTVLAFGFEIVRAPSSVFHEELKTSATKRLCNGVMRSDSSDSGADRAASELVHKNIHNVDDYRVSSDESLQGYYEKAQPQQFSRPTTRRAKRHVLNAVSQPEKCAANKILPPSTLLTPQEPVLHVKHMVLPETLYRQSNGYLPEPLDFSCLPSLLEPQIHDLIDRLAENVHNVWAEKRMRAGWRHGQSEDSQTFLSPHLVPFDELEQAVKKANMDTAQATILSLIAYGFHFVRHGVSAGASSGPKRRRTQRNNEHQQQSELTCHASAPSIDLRVDERETVEGDLADVATSATVETSNSWK